MSSPFLDATQIDTTILEDGSQTIFAATLGAINLQPSFPVKVNDDQQFYSTQLEISDVNNLETRLDSIITNPFPGTLSVQNVTTAYNTTPVNLNTFIANTLSNLSNLNSETQYITATIGNTHIASNVSTNDVYGRSYRNSTGSTFIDMSSLNNISINATNLDFNGNHILTSPLTADFDLGTYNVINTGTITPSANNTKDIGTFLDNYKDIYLAGKIQGSGLTTSANAIVSGPVSAVNNNVVVFNGLSGKLIKDSGVSISSLIAGGPSGPSGLNGPSGPSGVSGPQGLVGPSGIQGLVGPSGVSGPRGLIGPSGVSGPSGIVGASGPQGLIGPQGISGPSGIVGASGVSGPQGLQGATGSFANPSTTNLNMNGFSISNVLNLNGKIANSLITNDATNDSLVVGRNSSSAGTYGVAIGVANNVTNNTAGNIALGSFCNAAGDTTPSSGGGGAIAIGFTVDAINKESIAIGSGLSNSTASSLLIAGTAPMINWRTSTDNTCDIGVVGASFKDIYAKGSLIGGTNTRTIDNIVSNSSTGSANNICSFVSNKVIQDSGASISTASSTLNIGLTNTTSGSGSISVGAANTAGGSSGGKSIIYGNNNNTSGSTNGQCIIYGNDNTDSNAAGGSFIYGFTNTNGTGQRNILIGRNNTVPNGINEAFVMGFANTNSTSNSFLVGGVSHTNIRAGSTICDLGTVANPFKDIYTNGIVKTNTVDPNTGIAMTVGGTNATSLALGRSAINTSVLGPLKVQQIIDNTAANILQIGPTTSTGISIGHSTITTQVVGDFTTIQGNASWYSNSSYLPSFTANIARLIPPTTTTTGSISLFTQATPGVLTYNGLVTRTFHICYNISMVTGPNGSNMTFFNSINGSLVIGTTQARIVFGINAFTANSRIHTTFTDNVILSAGQTIQLAATSAASTGAISFDFVSCNVLRLFE